MNRYRNIYIHLFFFDKLLIGYLGKMQEKGKVVIIMNPVSGNRRSKIRRSRLLDLMTQRGISYVCFETKYKGHAMELVQGLKEESASIFLIGMGGDGTNNELVNGIMQLPPERRENLAYCLFPSGTGNDWARSFDIPIDPSCWLDMWQEQFAKKHDLGLVRYYADGQEAQRYFINIAGMAYDAYLVGKLEKGFMSKSNKLVYLGILLRCLMAYRLHPVQVESDSYAFQSKCYTINVGINRFAGGGMEVVPDADAFDGLLSITAAKDLKKYQVVYELRRFYNGTYTQIPKVEAFDAKAVKVSCTDADRILEVEADGEYLGVGPCTFQSIPAAFNVIMPKKNN